MSFVHDDPDFSQLLAIVSRETGISESLNDACTAIREWLREAERSAQ